jgi:hypothetical protein
MTAFKAWWKCLSVNSIDILSENKTVGGYHLGYLIGNPAVSKELMTDLNILLDLYQSNKIKVKVDSIFPFSKIGEAMKRMHSRQNIGKIILKPDSEMNQEAVLNTEEINLTTPAEPISIVEVSKVTISVEKPKAEAESVKALAQPVVETVVAEETTKESADEDTAEQNGNALTG